MDARHLIALAHLLRLQTLTRKIMLKPIVLLIKTVVLISAAVMALSASASAQDKVVRIGLQKSSTLLTILKARGTLEAGADPRRDAYALGW